MVFLTKLDFENFKNLVTPSPLCKVGRVTELPDDRATSSPWETKNFQGLDDDFGLKRPNHHLGPEYVHLFRAKKNYGIWGDFSEKFQVLCKNPDEVTRFDGISILTLRVKRWKTLLTFWRWSYIIFSTMPLVSPSRSESLLFSGCTFFVLISGSLTTSRFHHSILFFLTNRVVTIQKRPFNRYSDLYAFSITYFLRVNRTCTVPQLKRCRLYWLTNSTLVYELKCRGSGGGCGVSSNDHSCAHVAQINFGDLTSYLTYVSRHPSIRRDYEFGFSSGSYPWAVK